MTTRLTPEERAQAAIMGGLQYQLSELELVVAAAIRAVVEARDREWGAMLMRITQGHQSEESPFPPDEASIRAWFQQRAAARP